MSTSVDIIRGGHIKEGDTLPALRAQLFEDGEAFVLGNYSVTIRIKLAEDDTLTVDSSATVEQSERGIVEYEWKSGETDIAGTYEAEFVASDGQGDVITFPNIGYADIYIQSTLG